MSLVPSSQIAHDAQSALTAEEMVEEIEALRQECLSHLRRNCKCQADLAEDLFQDSACRALLAREKFKRGTNFRAWFYFILQNCYINHYRRVKMKSRHQTTVDLTFELWCNHSEDPEAEVLEMQAVKRLWEDWEKKVLPQYLEPLRLHVLEDLPYKQIAQDLDCSIGTVMSRIFRAKKAIRKLLDVSSYAGAKEVLYTP